MARFRGFDGLRALAVVLVIGWHGAGAVGFPEQAMGFLRPLVRTGWAGVDLFFALSGFLITALLLDEEHRGGIDLPRFYLRRALRILVPFYLVVLVEVMALGRMPGFPSVGAAAVLDKGSALGLWPYLTFWGNYFAIHGPRLWAPVWSPGKAFLVFWSLCVEEHFYLLWPGLLRLVRTPRLRVFAIALVLVLAPLLRLRAALAGEAHASIHVLTHYRLDSLLWGAAGALLWRHRAPSRHVRRGLLAVACAGIVALVATGGLSVKPEGSPLGVSVGLSLLAVATTLVLLELAAEPSGRLARVLEWRPLAFVGRRSYGMYLLHFPAIDVGRRVLSGAPREPSVLELARIWALFVGLSFVAAMALYVIAERPLLGLRRRLAPRFD